MKICVRDIPSEGRNLEFSLALAGLHERLKAEQEATHKGEEKSKIAPPAYQFASEPKVKLFLTLEGRNLILKGSLRASFTTVCSRCLADVGRDLNVPIDMLLKPASQRVDSEEDQDDLHLGFYDGEEVDCVPFLEEFVVLGLPYIALCSENCLGICQGCGKNLNDGPCECKQDPQGDERLAIFRTLKLH